MDIREFPYHSNQIELKFSPKKILDLLDRSIVFEDPKELIEFLYKSAFNCCVVLPIIFSMVRLNKFTFTVMRFNIQLNKKKHKLRVYQKLNSHL